MQWIISPAKRMEADRDTLPHRDLPVFLEEADRLRAHLRGLPYAEFKALLACNDALAESAFRQYGTMDLRRGLSPALLAYRGIQYRYMAPGVLETEDLEALQAHLRILSGLYGLLRPLDGAVCYRLELQARLRTPFCRDLYDYWGDRPARRLAEETDLVLNLASEEYARLIRRRRPPGLRLVDAVFAEAVGGRLVERGVYVKMARGEMVRFLAKSRARTLEDVKAFRGLGYRFSPEASGEDRLVFVRQAEEAKKEEF